MKTILRSYDIIRSGYVGPNYPAASLCPHIHRKERILFKQCFLGTELYDLMLEDLIVYTGIEKYNPSIGYLDGVKVEFNGFLLKSLDNNNVTSPEDDAYVGNKWEELPQFKTGCYNLLWENSLKDYITLMVIHTSIRYTTYKATGFGLMKHFDDTRGKSTVSLTEFNAWKQELYADAQESLKNVYDFIVDNAESCIFVTNINDCGEDDCDSPKSRNRRILFKN